MLSTVMIYSFHQGHSGRWQLACPPTANIAAFFLCNFSN